MRKFKAHIVIFFLALFALSAVASSAVAHCGHDAFTGSDVSMDMAGHHSSVDKAEASSCGGHDHGSASATNAPAEHHNDHDSNSMDCEDCTSVPCQNKIQILEGATPSECIDAEQLHSNESIHFKSIFLTIIPNPPNQNS
ncbi:MAG: hypothetical protein IME98_05430 [Proteobacteria bacterium]|nr:hypothetical protein [Pseudomonadota bacterium]